MFSGSMVAAAGILSVIAGLVLDAVRYFLLHLLKTFLVNVIPAFRELHNFSTKGADEHDIKYHDWVIENHFRFHQFYGNIFLGLVTAIFLLREFITGFCAWNCVAALVIVIGCSAALSYRATVKMLYARFSDKGKIKGDVE